jgi:hypothetical protein
MKAVKVFIYSNVMQFKKVLKGDFKVLKPLFLAKIDLLINTSQIIKTEIAFLKSEFEAYRSL